jgi:hypothetical protein
LTWFFTVGQVIAFTPAISSAAFQRTLAARPFIIASTFIGLLLPAGVITAAMEGPEGLRRLSAAVRRYRIPARWYLLPVVGIPATTLALHVLTVGFPATAPPARSQPQSGSGSSAS